MIYNVSDTGKNINGAILSALQYYSVFHYPLKAEEIYGNLNVRSSMAAFLVALEELEAAGAIYRHDGFYSIERDMKQLVAKRKEANKLAQSQKRLARIVARFLFLFPFVKFVGISGSLSKGYADDKSDFDYFIITAQNRLWLCRTLLHVFKKLTFIVGQQHKFCMNYFIDDQCLEIQEQNRYTAVEVCSMIPVCGNEVYNRFKKDNEWVRTFLPNGYISFDNDPVVIYDSSNVLKRLLQVTLNLFSPERINRWLMTLTDKKWRRKWQRRNYPMEDYDVAFKTTIHVSKNHSHNHQKRVLNALHRMERNGQ